MSFLHLTVELIFDLILIVMGVLLMVRSTDNYPRFYWGIIVMFIGIMFSWENIVWLFTIQEDPKYEYTDILNIEKMLKWFVMASSISLFPMASLRPGYLNHYRLIGFLLPPTIVTTTGICYLFFNGNITPIDSISMLLSNINKLDVKLRLTIFLFSVFLPLFYFLYPIVNKQIYRKVNNTMHLFVFSIFILLGIFISFSLFISPLVFNGFGIACIVFAILFSIEYLRWENPFSDRIQHKEEKQIQIFTAVQSQSENLFLIIENYLKEKHPYVSDKYSNENLASHLKTKESEISSAIKSAGYSGFREYINFLRLERFRNEASNNPDKTVKELMHACGFTSRSTFYRLFQQQYGISPTKFIENQMK